MADGFISQFVYECKQFKMPMAYYYFVMILTFFLFLELINSLIYVDKIN